MANSTITSPKKVILITGANSGLGFQCSLALARQENTHVILAGRNQQRIDEAVAQVTAVKHASSIVESGIVDLASLVSVRQYARSLIQRDLHFYTIVCNAGVQVKTKTHTVDGFESTIGVNHIAHFLLLKLLKDRTQHIVMLSSETHDPAEKTGLPAPDMSDLDTLAKGRESFDGLAIYATSKLCNLLYAKEFARRFPNGPEIVAYTPGLTPDTGLFRENPSIVWFFAKYVLQLYTWLVGGRTSTSEYSGGYMAKIASADSWTANGWKRGDYIRIDEVYEASAQARDEELGKALWDKSEEWIKAFAN